MAIRILFLLMIIIFSFTFNTYAEAPLKAAFIRDHQLWIKENDRERQLTKGLNVSSPKWSNDGRFIAYLAGDELGEKTYLYVYDTRKKENYQPYKTIQTSNFKWSPVSNQLAYNAGGVLNITKTKNGRPEGFENVSLGTSDFEWFPDGKNFIVSSQSNLLPTGWEPVRLFKVSVDANLNKNKIKPFYTIQTDPDDLFAISADYFKWSTDGKWVSFLAMPTASWSNDSNTLCVLSSKGDHFQVIGKMLWYENWIKWAPTKNQLAFISGEGRFFVENKNTTITDIPTIHERKEYTPKGYVDLDLEWLSLDKVIVARAKENKEWKEGPVPTMFTSLYVINIKSGEQKQITFPNHNRIDDFPQVIDSKITWYRKTEKSKQGDVWIKDGISSPEHLWLKRVDVAPTFYKE
ncbi:translocation protein TolB [Heyndrickxia shackletonii]|uniref:Translocation protein TolB n=1 Tax=Heyndrickxia shackletonii TaxID=157838 RepID=A0A0Q3WWM2_9BACI|nr:translocation protein TolB [Heyndrickxia shackletonii]KQL54413.1 translocation protein TolB [Heyndrickxia shackletonii]NEY99130.1 translocation protein TolB [Heyndrickxia shackletonii]